LRYEARKGSYRWSIIERYGKAIRRDLRVLEMFCHHCNCQRERLQLPVARIYLLEVFGAFVRIGGGALLQKLQRAAPKRRTAELGTMLGGKAAGIDQGP
jgi:hypothetical protein